MRLFTSLLFAFSLAACDEEETNQTPQDYSDCDSTDGDAYDFGTVNIDGLDDEPYIDGDGLHVPVSYGGGCEEHIFVICWPEQAFMESDPVQVSLDIWHEANGDTCEAYLSEDLDFDLTELKESYQDAYLVEEGTILIGIGGSVLTYTF